TAELALRADLPGDAGELVGEGPQLVHHRDDRVLQLQDLALYVHRDLLREIAARHGRRDLGNVAHLAGEVPRHEVDAVGQVLPRPGNSLDLRLTAEPALRADLPGHPGDLVGERAQRVGHPVDRLGQRGDLALGLNRDLLGEVAARYGRRGFTTVARLAGEVARHEVDAVGQVLPRPRDPRNLRLAAEPALRADLPGHPGDLVGERAQRVGHPVDRLGQRGDLALGLNREIGGAAGRRSGE